MTWRLHVADTARSEILAALAHTYNEFGLSQLDEYSELIEQAIAEISEDPFGPRTRSRDDTPFGLRTLHIGRRGRRARHLLLFRPTREGTVEVLRFLHDSMDLPRHLPSD